MPSHTPAKQTLTIFSYVLCLLLTVFAVQMIFQDSFHSLLAMLVLLLTPHCLFFVVSIAQKVWTNCQCVRKPFSSLHNLWTKRHQIKDQQNMNNNEKPSGATEQTRLLHVNLTSISQYFCYLASYRSITLPEVMFCFEV